MAGLLKDDFSTKRPITQVPAAWFNAVAKILNGITAGVGININKNGTDTAGWEFELDLEYAKKYLGIEDAEKPDDLTHEDITDWDTATADFLDGDDYDAIIEAIGDVEDIVDGILADYLDSGDINVTVAAKNHTHTTANITDWATATADFLTDADMSNYALEADLLTLAEEVTGIEVDILDLADAVEAIDTDLAALEDDFDDLYAALYPSGTKGWVDLTTAQTVGGIKTFSATTKHNSHIDISGNNSLRMFLNRNNGVQGWENISFFTLDNVNIGQVICGNDSEFAHGTYLRSYNGGSIYSGIGVHLDVNDKGSQNLERPPTEDNSSTSDKQIAWRGWVNNYFSRKTHNHDGVYSKTDHTHSGYATTNHTHSEYATTSSVSTLSGAVDELVDVVDGILADYVDEDELTTTLSTYSNTDTIANTYATKTALAEVDGDLADIADYVDSMDADIAALADWYATGTTGTFNVVTNVEWTGTVLRMSRKSVTFTNGLITAIGNDSTTTIDTPVLFEQS